jgi:hypothetical protein
MQTKPLLYGLIGFFIGGFLVSVAATTFDKPENKETITNTSMSSMSMDDMTVHHEGAVEMAKLSANNAKHEEIKNLSQAIISAQEKEIAEMKQWQADWGYDSNSGEHTQH